MTAEQFAKGLALIARSGYSPTAAQRAFLEAHLLTPPTRRQRITRRIFAVGMFLLSIGLWASAVSG
jgi:hypothetical protein